MQEWEIYHDATLATLYDNYIPEYPENERVTERICDLCGHSERGRRTAMKKAGWGLYPEHIFCPTCESEI